ncbi:MAG: DNA topoisomerase 3 [Clostridia bacterium]|nr:DNA topoisomerase 3 [Clostridia bacterium]
MIVIVAEKPSVGRDIARVLGCRQPGEGCISGEKYTVTWALGHLVTLCEPDEIDEKYKKWKREDLPILPDVLPTKVIGKTRKQFSVVKKLMNAPDTERVICATDAGREGELIFYYIYCQAKCSKPVDRLWISSMTDEAIREGFDTLKPDEEYVGLRRSAVCRSEADWLVGMNASRAFTLRYNALLSVGRVQTPTLNILVKRRREIDGFQPEQYYVLSADFGDYKGQWFDPSAEDEKTAHRIPEKERAEAVADKVRRQPARVVSAVSEEKKELPPQLYDLTSLQRDANRILGFTAEKTLKVAQSLYEKWKLLTYPRTDSRYLPMDMVGKLYQTLKVLPEPYRSLETGMERREDGKLYLGRRIFDNAKVSDHHALLPTPKAADLEKLPGDERALYDLVVRRMLAAFYPAYVYDALKVVTECSGESFRSTGRTVRTEGWKALYRQDQPAKKTRTKKKDAEEETEELPLPPLHPGDERTVVKTDVQQSTTKPPAPHTDASLLAAMEHAGRQIEDETLRESMKGAGLGTPATRAAIIERLLQVGYAARRGRAIQATDKGMRLIEAAPEEIASPELTGKWELALDEIARSERDTERFMQGIRRMSEFLVEYAFGKAPDVTFPEEMRRGTGGKKRTSVPKKIEGAVCPLCGKTVQENAKAFGCSAWKEGCRFTLWKDGLVRGGGPALNARIVQILLKNGEAKGSTGILRLKEGQLSFTPNGAETPAALIPITYSRK